jgi:hypothetical protein
VTIGRDQHRISLALERRPEAVAKIGVVLGEQHAAPSAPHVAAS